MLLPDEFFLVRFLMPTAVTAKTAFRNVIPCSLVDMHRRFRRTCCFHRLGSLPAHLFKMSLRTRLHDVRRWKRVTHLSLSAVTCGQTDSDSAYALLCTDVKSRTHCAAGVASTCEGSQFHISGPETVHGM